MLEELSKKDQTWRKIATKICGCKYLADDIVNEMYLKIHKRNPEKWNTHYISYCMYHLFLNHKKKNKYVFIDDFSWIKKQVEDQTTEQRKKIDKLLNELHIFDREILLLRNEMSLSQCAEELNKISNDKIISRSKIDYQARNAFERLMQTNGVKKLLKNGL